ncbi:hypothetical protein PTKIN_Ptkin12aG0154200 [Pterospermum kingtungense]
MNEAVAPLLPVLHFRASSFTDMSFDYQNRLHSSLFSRHPQDALVVFDKLPQRSNLAWNGIIRGFHDVGCFSKAIEFYQLMVSQGFIPDNLTYPLVLRACGEWNDLEEGKKIRDFILWNESNYDTKCNLYVECAMIDMFTKCGSLSEARKIFEGIREKDLARWGALICGNMQSGDIVSI